ncbi:unnamed protein product [Haemonchus placei]|uniref:Uncharacterized protein n=1 Tax=Haemonchus placei TaxID=6290 RepID=A0A0N4X3Z7_HAEPC|nr:unnamed protein product [Haemonchus placei]
MTKLDKLAVRVVKRVAETTDVTADDGGNRAIIEALQKPYVRLLALKQKLFTGTVIFQAGAEEGHNLLDEAVIDGGLPREQIEKTSDVAESSGKSGVSFSSPQSSKRTPKKVLSTYLWIHLKNPFRHSMVQLTMIEGDLIRNGSATTRTRGQFDE